MHYAAYFYPRPLRGGRQLARVSVSQHNRFLSTPSARRATDSNRAVRQQLYEFLSTPSARRATSSFPWPCPGCPISIHALREEGDAVDARPVHPAGISIHALREEGDVDVVRCAEFHGQFLSTPSARRATILSRGGGCTVAYFYPRPPRGGRPAGGDDGEPYTTISIHALREEGDDALQSLLVCARLFLSTPSARRATVLPDGSYGLYPISIHALREEGDRLRWTVCLWSGDFYPRPPRGGRPTFAVTLLSLMDFYPRPPRGGRRDGNNFILTYFQFLSTPSARRATRSRDLCRRLSKDFYPRPPRGGRRGSPASLGGIENFYPRPPRGGRQYAFSRSCCSLTISIHALREEGDSLRTS